MLCAELHCQKVFKLKLFFYEILTQRSSKRFSRAPGESAPGEGTLTWWEFISHLILGDSYEEHALPKVQLPYPGSNDYRSSLPKVSGAGLDSTIHDPQRISLIDFEAYSMPECRMWSFKEIRFPQKLTSSHTELPKS